MKEDSKMGIKNLIESAKVMEKTGWKWSGNLGMFMKRF